MLATRSSWRDQSIKMPHFGGPKKSQMRYIEKQNIEKQYENVELR